MRLHIIWLTLKNEMHGSASAIPDITDLDIPDNMRLIDIDFH